MAVQPKRFCLFNCDNTYDLKIVEEFLLEVDEKYQYNISVDSLSFALRLMAEMVETALPTMKMDFAIFVVHANESRLSINEDNAGIGYARLYKALQRATDDKVLIVIGGDSYYKDEDEEDRSVISRWARRKVASQFNEEYLDGRKSFIFSWDKKHRPIHEEALRHYLDPSKKGFKFVYTPKPKLLPRPAEPEFTPPANQDTRQEPFLVEDDGDKLIKNEEETSTRRRSVSIDRGGQKNGLRGDKEEANYGAMDSGASVTSVDYPAGTVLLQTRMRYGEISYEAEDVLARKDRWEPAERQVTHLREDYRSTPEAEVRFISTGYGGVSYDVMIVPNLVPRSPRSRSRSPRSPRSRSRSPRSPRSRSRSRSPTVRPPKPDCCTRLKNWLCSCCTGLKNCLLSCCICLKNCLLSCCICLKNCFVACFLGLVHYFGLLWGWIVGLFRR